MRIALRLVLAVATIAGPPAGDGGQAAEPAAAPRGGSRPLFAPAPGSPIRVGRGSGTVVLTDIDGNGRVDLLTRHLQNRMVTVQLGDARGGFTAAPAGPLTFSYDPGDIAAGDLNEDGIPDLAVTPGTRDVVDVLLGDGKGAFARAAGSPHAVTEAIEPFNKRTLHLLDVNEDGHLDAITANGRRRTSLGVLFGDGRGGFARGPVVQLDPGADGYSLAFGDLDGDGHLDVVSASREGFEADSGPGRLLVQSGDGRGAFTPVFRRTLAVRGGPRAVSLADVDGDRRLDIVVLHAGGPLTILRNMGRAGFEPAPGGPNTFGADAYALRVADLTQDGRPDFAAATVTGVSVLVAAGDGYVPAAGSPFGAGPGAYNLGLGDLNRDGKPDVAVSSFEGDGVTVLLAR